MKLMSLQCSQSTVFIFAVPADLPILLEHLDAVERDIAGVEEHINPALH